LSGDDITHGTAFLIEEKKLLLHMAPKSEYPLYVLISLNLLSVALVLTGLYLAGGIIIPLCFSILLASLLTPFVSFLQRLKMPRTLAISVSIILSISIIGTVLYFLSTQIGNFLDDIPTLKLRFQEVLGMGKQWIKENFNIGIRQQNEYLKDTAEQMKTNGTDIVQSTVITLTEIVSYVIFLPIYCFLILYHKDIIKRFLIEIFRRTDEDQIMDVIYESQAISQAYLTGLLIELLIVFALNSIGFLILGIKYPIFLALIAALLNLVPYIGMITASIFSMLVTMVSSHDITMIFWVGGVLGAVQLVDNNILMPFIVGSKVKINSLAIILGVLFGGALWGIPGMFLAIPVLAFMKVVFERVETLKPWAILLGDNNGHEEEKSVIKSALIKAKSKVAK
jgi:predicted PurR-regulated permease PerM